MEFGLKFDGEARMIVSKNAAVVAGAAKPRAHLPGLTLRVIFDAASRHWP
jgi:hypothetical protein